MTATSNTTDGDTVDPAVRESARGILDANPTISCAGFKGKLLKMGVEKDTAAQLYAELVDQDTLAPGDATDTETSDERGDSGTDALANTIDGYYAALDERDVYADLGEIGGDAAGTDTALSCIGNQDFRGWYRDAGDVADPWDGRARAYALAREFGAIRDGLDRTLYATINYAPTAWFMDAWDRYQWRDESREWHRGAAPTPEYDDVLAYAPFADIDLADDVKADRPAGDVPIDDLEDALGRYIDAFADLAGGRDHVFALDSVGGAYVMLAPTTTTPIATEFDRDDRAVLFDELTDRLNDWLDDVGERVTDATDLAGVFEPDKVNHKNRLYKAPLSVHKSLDGVVTPIDTGAPTYEFTPLTDADSALVDDTQTWIDGFTTDHRDAVGAIVATLWPDYYADADTWDAALAAWLEDRHEADQDNRERERERIPPGEIPDDLETTDNLEIIESKIEAIDVEALAKDLADGVNDDRDKLRFNPPWRRSDTGESCIADTDKFADVKEDGGGGALKLVALGRGIIDRSTDALEGRDYWRAVNALRDEGYSIPYYEGPDGRHPDVLRLFTEPDGQEEKKKQLARALFADRS